SVAGERLVPIPDRLEEILKNWLLTTRFPADQDPVFPTIKGRPFDYKNHWRRFGGPVAEELGLKNVSYHSFRHTANTGAGVAG
ncbi:MAG: hypothetical protein GWO24_02610, partial [Akkermansiaceae bacterium]|nr:hypothetical protein [Akkermansiaceae bacterium]